MEFQPLGVHIAHVIIGGVIGQPRGGQSSSSTASLRTTSFGDESMDPDAVAQTYWQLHVQDRSAWTQEIDLRPSNPPRFFEEVSLQEPLALELGTTWGGASSCGQRFQSISQVVWN
ncbi:hypothetical protein ACE6H2_024444 [Prunus campanulata]